NAPFISEGPQNGQWPAIFNNQWQSLPEPQIYYESGHAQFISEDPQNGQWPATSNNQWQSQPEPQPYNDPAQLTEKLSVWEGPFAQTFNYPQDIPSSSEAPFVGQPKSTYHPSADFNPFPPPKQAGADEQNFIPFDPLLSEAPDNIQHPLTKEGKPTSYHFETASIN